MTRQCETFTSVGETVILVHVLPEALRRPMALPPHLLL